MAMADVTLLSLPASPFAMSVKMALNEKGISFKTLEENYREKGKSEMLLEVNPVSKQVPVLIHNNKPVYESLVILEYIEDVWKSQGTQLLPHDPYMRAKTRFWANFCNTKFWEKALLIMKRRGVEQMKARDEVVQMFQLMENEWSKPEYGRPFLFGNKLSMADLVLAPLVSWKLSLETLGKFEFFPRNPENSRMREWFNAVEDHPSVKASILAADLNLENANHFQKWLATA